MGESLLNETLTIREPYDPILRRILLVNAAIIAALGLGFGIAKLLDSNRSVIELISTPLAMILCFVVSYGLWRADLVLQINDERVT